MLLLTSTSDIVRVVTGTAVNKISVHVSYVDNLSGTLTPDRRNWNVTTATTTTIVQSPAASTQRNVRTIYIENNDAALSTIVTVQHFDGTTSSDIISVTLLPGENINMDENGTWHHRDANGGEYGFTPIVTYPYAITGHKAESIPRTLVSGVIAATSGTMAMQAIWLPAGLVINNLITQSGTTASATQTNRWLALYDQNRNLLRQSTDQTTTVLAASTLYTAAITSYTTTYSGLYYIGLLVAATTVNNWVGVAGAAGIRGQAPILAGTSSSGLTSTAPATAGAITAGSNTYWVAVS